jgi:beta-1,4-mannosyltransferase
MVCAIVRLFSWPISFCSKDLNFKRRKGTRVIIDWHNYGWTILEVNRANKTLVKCAKAFEIYFGRFADYHLTVSKAMKEHLGSIAPAINRKPIHVLYDRATPKFK